jgi:SAM-dependent methyltransferase
MLGIIAVMFSPRRAEAIRIEGRNILSTKVDAKILDVGFGAGAFLKLAKAMGREGFGIDTDPITVENAKNEQLDVKLGDIQLFEKLGVTFDAITLSHVIEHVHYPKKLMESTFNCLRPGGQIWIETPNIDSFGHAKFGKHWRGLEAPRHLVIFSWCSLENMLKEMGYINICRKPRYGLYESMANSSGNAGSFRITRVFSRIVNKAYGVYAYFLCRKNFNNTEFITLTAERPL